MSSSTLGTFLLTTRMIKEILDWLDRYQGPVR